MPDNPPPVSPPPAAGFFLVFGGVLFATLWIVAHLVWIFMSFMASAMANDSGAASTNQQMVLIFGMLGGQVLTTAAGIPAGVAFFWRSHRKRMLGIFAILFVLGALIQVWAFHSFFAGASGRS